MHDGKSQKSYLGEFSQSEAFEWKNFKCLSAGLQQHQSRSHQKISYGKVKRRRKEMVSVAAENLPGIGDLQI